MTIPREDAEAYYQRWREVLPDEDARVFSQRANPLTGQPYSPYSGDGQLAWQALNDINKNILRTQSKFKTQRRKGAINNPSRRSEGLKRTANRRYLRFTVGGFIQRRNAKGQVRRYTIGTTAQWAIYHIDKGEAVGLR